MGYVKGCDITNLSGYVLKKFDNQKIMIADELSGILSLEHLKEMFEKTKEKYYNGNNEEVKGAPSGTIYVLYKKIDGVKYLLGAVFFRKMPGEAITKKGLAKVFANSTDRYVMEERYFAPGYEKEEEYFDESILSYLKDHVGMGQIKEGEYLDKMVVATDKKNFFGITIGKTLYFIFMLVVWAYVFKSVALGICFAFLFTSSFTMITARTKTKEESVPAGEDFPVEEEVLSE
ncbi:MAG: hypothetical protein J5517_07615 [Eubacterium sp.]|nr:hypothetical protein [Eubacterium sp.]